MGQIKASLPPSQQILLLPSPPKKALWTFNMQYHQVGILFCHELINELFEMFHVTGFSHYQNRTRICEKKSRQFVVIFTTMQITSVIIFTNLISLPSSSVIRDSGVYHVSTRISVPKSCTRRIRYVQASGRYYTIIESFY